MRVRSRNGKRKAPALSGTLRALSSHWTELEILPAPSSGLGCCSPNCHNLDSWDPSLLPHVDSALEIDARQHAPSWHSLLPPRSWVTRARHDSQRFTTFKIAYIFPSIYVFVLCNFVVVIAVCLGVVDMCWKNFPHGNYVFNTLTQSCASVNSMDECQPGWPLLNATFSKISRWKISHFIK